MKYILALVLFFVGCQSTPAETTNSLKLNAETTNSLKLNTVCSSLYSETRTEYQVQEEVKEVVDKDIQLTTCMVQNVSVLSYGLVAYCKDIRFVFIFDIPEEIAKDASKGDYLCIGGAIDEVDTWLRPLCSVNIDPNFIELGRCSDRCSKELCKQHDL